ncbi:hypothetical protein LTR15_004365 [Elasticomyces elasticus]|nr:hypothetical protein LTR15_004365 [Elasticomyces elasticus]
MHYAPALLALAGLAAAYKIPPLNTTEWCLAKCNDVGGDSCVAACVGNPNLSAEQIHAAHECEFKCHIPSKGAEGDLACLRACHKRYHYATTSTKAATSTAITGGLARRSDLAASTTMFAITATGIPAPPLATPTAISLTPAEKCLSTCNPVGDRSCVAACIGNPSLSSAQVAAAHRCYSTCPMGDNDSVEDWNAYMTCLRVCDTRYYSTISTKAATSTATSGGVVRRSDVAASTTMFSITVTGPSGSTNTIVSPFVSPKEACHAWCPSVPSPYPGTKVAAIRGCQVACQEIIFNPKDHFNKYASCLLTCFDSYYDPNTGTKVNPLPLSSADIGVGPRSIQAAADTAETLRSPTTTLHTTTTLHLKTTVTPAMSFYTPPVPMPSTKETCLASCIPGDLDCEYICIYYPLPYPDGPTTSAYGDCDAACKRLAIMEEDADLYRDCLEECEDSYYDPSTNTKASAIAATNAGLGPRDPITAASPTRTPTSAMSSATHTASLKEKCIASCGPKDIDCAIDCINAESHFPGQDAAAQECEAACREFIAMAKDPGGLPACLMVCAYSYDEVSTGNAQFTVTIPNSDLVPRATPTAASTSLFPTTTSKMLPATQKAYPLPMCVASCAATDLICRHVCAQHVDACEAACPRANTPREIPVHAACLRACNIRDNYPKIGPEAIGWAMYSTSTSLGPRATLTAAATTPQLAQRSLIPVDIVPDSPDIEVSPKERCLTKCSPEDIACKARCVGVPNPNAAPIAATNKCEAACPQGNGTAAQTQFYAACMQKCVDSFYFSGTGTIAAGITATATTTTTSGSMVLGSTTAVHSTVSRHFLFDFGSSSSTSSGSVTLGSHSATGGSTASSSPTGGPASSGSAPKLGQAGGLLGLMMAMLAL